MDVAPSTDWKVIISMARIAGARIPSEIIHLRWEHVDWANDRVLITSPKTAHKGKPEKYCPLFPELAQVLQAAFDAAEPGTEFVIGGCRSAGRNLRTQFGKIIRRAGLTPWPKLFQNLRSSRATELRHQFPAYLVNSWIGHDEDTANEHYTQVRPEDYARAAKTMSLPSANAKNWRNERKSAQEKTAPESQQAVSVSGTPIAASHDWARQDSNLRRQCQRVYSPSPLATWVHAPDFQSPVEYP